MGFKRIQWDLIGLNGTQPTQFSNFESGMMCRVQIYFRKLNDDLHSESRDVVQTSGERLRVPGTLLGGCDDACGSLGDAFLGKLDIKTHTHTHTSMGIQDGGGPTHKLVNHEISPSNNTKVCTINHS